MVTVDRPNAMTAPPPNDAEFKDIVQLLIVTTELSANNTPPISAKFESSVQAFAMTLAPTA